MKYLRHLSLFLFSFVLLNQVASAQAGGAAVPFLLIAPDARAAGMGEAGTAIADNVNAVYWNPGGMGFMENQRQISLSFSRWLPQFNADLYYSYGTYGEYFSELNGMVAVNFILMNLGEFTRTSENGTVLGKFRSNEFSIGLSYGTLIADNLGAGVQVRYIRSNLSPITSGGAGAGAGTSLSFDLSTLWKPTFLDDRFSFGVNLQNIGPKVTYIREADPLPTNLRVGTAVQLVNDEFNDLKIAVDVSKLLVKRDSLGSDPLPTSLVTAWQTPGAEFSIGAEYWYAQAVALRAGFFSEPSRIGGRQFLTFGAGVQYNMFQLDFSFINTIEQNHPLANTMRFSMLINFDKMTN